METGSSVAALPDGALLCSLHELVARDRVIEVDLLAHLGEVEARRLHLVEGCSSLFGYCTEVLRFSEATAYLRSMDLT